MLLRVARMVPAQGRLMFCGPILLIALVCAGIPGMLAPYDPYSIDPIAILSVPSFIHPLGTDELGRDILSRIIFGARISLGVAVGATSIAAAVGVTIGCVISYTGGRLENLAMRVIDVFVCLPEIFIAILAVAIFKPDVQTLILTIGFIYFPQFARVAHNVTAAIKHREYVLSARSLGASRGWIVCNEILPNILPIVIVQISLSLSLAMLLEAALSFLGLGIAPPTPSWGQMIGSLKDYIFNAPWCVAMPSFVLMLVVLALNVAGDLLQDAFTPEARH